MEKINWPEVQVSSTGLKAAKVSTRNFIHYKTQPRENKHHFDFGNCVELKLLDEVNGTNTFEEYVAIFDEDKIIAEVYKDNPASKSPRATKIYKEERDLWEMENEGKYHLNSTGKDSYESVLELVNLAKMHPNYDLLQGEVQTTFKWKCPVTGLNRYCRTDVLNKEKRYILDIKTDVSGDFQRVCMNLDYPLQLNDHIEGCLQTGTLDVVEKYYYFVLHTAKPFHIDIYTVDVDQLLVVEESYWSTLKRLAHDLNNDPESIVFHDIPVKKLKIPGWYK